MSTWSRLFGLNGYYQSENIPLTLEGDGTINSISWDSIKPQGTSVLVYTSISFDGGYNWSEWKRAVNGSSIPDIDVDTVLMGTLLRFRAFLNTDSSSHVPVLNSIEFNFEPVLIFDNKGDTTCTPEIWVKKIGNGDLSLINTSNGNEEFKLTGIINNETVYVNSEREYIKTDLPTVYRYSNFNDNYLKLPIGKNVFRVQGSAKIQFRYQFKFI